MTHNELQHILIESLGDLLYTERGQVLYSGIETLRRGKFYFLDFNPAADGTNPLLVNVPLDVENWSAYTQQCWHCGEFRGQLQRCCGKRKLHQRQAIQVMRELSLIPEQTFASNLIFMESARAPEIYKRRKDLLPQCWDVHKKFLTAVKPTYIVSLGKEEPCSAFGLLHGLGNKPPIHRDRNFKRFTAEFDLGNGELLKTTVVGVRHPSYPMNPLGLSQFINHN